MKTQFVRVIPILCLLLLISLACNLTNLGSTQQSPTEIPAQPETQVLPQEASPTAEEVVQPTDTAVPPTEQVEPEAVESDISFEGISFSYDPSLASSIETGITPQSNNPDDPTWMKSPELIGFTFIDFPVTGSNHKAVISVFSIEEYSQLDPSTVETFAQLQTLLAARPSDPETPLPYMPVVNAGQVIAARIHYIDFENGSGIAYLTQYAQDVSPINNQALFYTFQGVTNDGIWYVTADFPVTHPELPPDSNIEDYNAFADSFSQYLVEIKAFLDNQPAESFTPNLALLDDVFRSLKVK